MPIPKRLKRNNVVFSLCMPVGAAGAMAESSGTTDRKNKITTFAVVEPAGTVGLTGAGEIVSPFKARTELVGCRAEGPTAMRGLEGGVCAFTRKLRDREGHRCTVTDSFTSTKDSIRWEVEITSQNRPWTTAIDTHIQYPVTRNSRFWTTWGHPTPGHRPEVWADPLQAQPLAEQRWDYQFPHVEKFWNYPEVQGRRFSIPLFTFLDPVHDTALTLVQSPEDTLLDLTLSTTARGEVRLSRKNHRLGEGRTVRFAMDLVAHAADPRAGLGWMVKRYAQFFNTGTPAAEQLSGCGAYSGDERPIDAAKFKNMGFRFNWKLSDDFPYMGNFLPVTDMDERWQRANDEPRPAGKEDMTSCRQMNDYARWMKSNGFHVLSYFNVTEYGRKMKYPPPARQAKRNADLWKDPHDFLFHGGRASAVIMIEGQPQRSNCYGALIVDPGDPDYCKHLLEQVRRNNELLPDVDGICIDRTDWLHQYNADADDGISWVNDKPARSLFISWQNLMDKMAPLLHKAGKVLFLNNCAPRLNMVGRADGIYCESAYPAFQNFSALTGVRKPVTIWTVKDSELTDEYMQRCLYLGIFPTAPYPSNNHCLPPSTRTDAQFLAYGPLMNAMRGRKWVLEPHCVETATPNVKVNLFEVPGGYALPVSFGGNANSAMVQIRHIPAMAKLKAVALHPGTDATVPVPVSIKNGVMTLLVPLVRGCAMVKLTNQ